MRSVKVPFTAHLGFGSRCYSSCNRPQRAALTRMPTVGFMRLSFPVVLLPCRIYAQGHNAICCAKPSPSPTISLIKFVVLLIKLNNLHVTNLHVGTSVSDF